MDVIVSPAKAFVASPDPTKLLADMKARMSQKEAKGKIKTWECDQDGDFRYLVQQYDGLAWIRPEVAAGVLRLKLVWPKDAEPTQDLKGIFFGRFIEMILGHFATAAFTDIRVVALS